MWDRKAYEDGVVDWQNLFLVTYILLELQNIEIFLQSITTSGVYAVMLVH